MDFEIKEGMNIKGATIGREVQLLSTPVQTRESGIILLSLARERERE
jgi:hypothetical protein